MKIRIGLPDDRDFAGWLTVLDADGAIIFGPVPAAGRSHDDLALAHGNASRNPLRLYGDTPLGTYAVRAIAKADHGKGHAAASVVLLEPETDQAALADAHGRFRFLIQGGGGDDELQATAGGIRLRESDNVRLVALVRHARGRVRCEISPTDQLGSMISLARAPTDHDPPALPGQPYVPIHPSAMQPGAIGAIGRGAGFVPRMFLATETSGAGGGGTSYGGAGGASGGGDMPDAPTGTTDDPLPASGVDIAPRPGIDLNLPADQTIVRIMDTPGGPLFPAATSPSGFTPIAGFQVGGWQLSIGTQTTDSYTNMPGTGPYTPYSGNLVGPYSGGPQEGVGSNQYTGTLPTEPYSNTVVASPASTGDQTGPTPVQRDTLDNEDAAIQQMVQRFQKYDQDLAASQAAQSQQAQIQTQPATPTNAPGTATSAGSAQPPPPASATTAGNSSADDSILPWGPAAAVGAASNQPNVPRATPPVSGQPANLGLESSGAWDRANPSQAAQAAIQDQIAAGFLDPSYGRPGANISSATASTEGSINRLIRGQTAEVSAYQARRAQGEIGILAPKGASVRGLDYATASRLPSGEYQINVADTASRYTTNPFKTSPGTAKPTWLGELANTFGPNGNFRLSDPAAEQGIRDAHAAGRISPVQIDTVDFSPQGQGRMTVNGVEVPIDSATTPTRGGGAGPGGGGTGNAAATGAALGGGIATLINAIQILWNPDAHPEAVRELVTTAFLGTASGATGATIESTFARSFASATGGAEASSIESAAGRSLGGAFAGGPAAAIFTLGQMALSDKEYTTVDYEAKGTRSFVSGTAGGLSGALAAGAVGAIGLSEVPLLGTAVGFVGGFLGYLAFDALFGDDVEDAVRGQPAQMGDFEVVQDPSGFLT